MRLRAVIFDLDGTLIDSETIYRLADEAFLADRDIVLDDAAWSDVVGIGSAAFLAGLKDSHGLQGDVGELVAEKDEYFLREADGRVRLFPAMRRLIDRLRDEGLTIAVATGSSTRVMRAMMDRVGLTALVQPAVSADEVPEGKPAPDVFLEAARRLGVPPSECLVVEDSQHGVTAAVAAGMTVVAVPADHSLAKPAFADAALVFPDGPDSIDPNVVLALITDRLDISRFQEIILDHYRRHGRTQPWRQTSDPYQILVSEVMLQQTQSDRVVPKYHAFLERFPTVEALARAPLSEVLLLWQGLGYNRRARHLRDAAATVVNEWGGRWPRTPEELERLSGVGPYTASAVATFAFGCECVFIETNIRRVFIHFFYGEEAQVKDADLLPFIRHTLYRSDPRTWYYALMDYGAYLACLFPNPNRRSAHYTRQGRFEDSTRQLRGRIVQELTRRSEADLSALANVAGFDEQRTRDALEELVRDGLLVADADTYRLSG